MKYRPEIDGLRALAVLPVIFFHAGLESFGGGFVGVDVFFVISGYLITSIIINELDKERFSLLTFYERRARRILPALIIVLTATYLLSWIFNLPAQHKVVGQYVVASIFFSSNLLLYVKGQDYFGLAADDNPLLHTWSLAVEEQYYILFPLVLMIAWRKGLRIILALFGVVAIASLLSAEFGGRVDQAAAFFMLPTRGWEILLGVFCALILKYKNEFLSSISEIGSISGLALIAWSVFYFDRDTPTPSFYILIPTIGTALIILFARKHTITNILLSNKFLVTVGLISYSAYLWHQPLLVFSRDVFGELSLWQTLIVALPVTFGLAYVTWYTIENYFRNRNRVSLAKLLGFVIPAACILASVGVIGHVNNGFEGRSEIFKRLATNPGFGLQCNGNDHFAVECASSSRPEIVTLGNSYMMQFVEAIASRNPKSGVLQLTQDACPIGLTMTERDFNEKPCDQFYMNSFETIKAQSSVKTVFISSTFGEVLDNNLKTAMVQYVKALAGLGLDIVLIGPTPTSPHDVGKCLARKHSSLLNATAKSCDFVPSDQHHILIERLRQAVDSIGVVRFLDITDLICPDGYCKMETENGLLMYNDFGHLTKEGANYVVEEMDLSEVRNGNSH